MFIYIVFGCGLVWYLLITIICLKHFHQGGRRMMRDMTHDYEAGPRIGKTRPWEPGERVEIRIMYWSTIVMMLLMAALYLQLAR